MDRLAGVGATSPGALDEALSATPTSRTFRFDFKGGIAGVWTAMADTARYNAAAALPRQTITEVPEPDGSVTFLGRARMGPAALEWEDLPCNWVRERWFEHRRRFTRGPLRRMDARLDLNGQAAGCRGDYRLEAEPNGLFGRVLLRTGFMASAERMFMRLSAEADRFAQGDQPVPFTTSPPSLPAGAADRLRQLARQLDESAHGHGLGRRLADEVAQGLEIDAERIRPLTLARRWGVPGLHAIEACLAATRLGMLELRWDLLCPRCRGAKLTVSGLDQLPTGAHCGSCNIDYGRDFSRNVELTFRPAASIRPLGSGEFCLFGPMSTPHVWIHLTLEPGEVRTVEAELPAGPWRLRTLEAGPETDIEHPGGPFPAVIVGTDGIVAGPAGHPGEITLCNDGRHRRTIVVEERHWVRDALTADRVATLQAFRDLFSDEVLRPGDEVAVRRVTLLFSDLKGSTSLYDAIGDATAYGLVRRHFAYLTGIVREHEGAVVKIMGDAVMAAFHDPLQALRAAIAMQRRGAGRAGITLKLGLHEGPCIAVTLNDRLDYFGGTVNLAARLQNESRGGDVVLSATLAALDGAAELLAPWRPEAETSAVRGLVEPVACIRITVDAEPAG